MEDKFNSEITQAESEKKFKIIQYKVLEVRLNQIWKKFTDAGFKPLLIKGWVTARKYPNPFERTFVDFDLVFKPDEFESAIKFKDENTFEFLVDLHNGARHLDNLSFEELYARSELVNYGDTEVRVPCEEDHLRIICVHWLNDGGEYKERLWDIYWSVENRKETFDWDKCLSVVSSKRRRWIICAIGVAHKYLGLDLEGTPIQKEAKKLPVWLTKTIEKEWRLNTHLKPLHHLLKDKKEFWVQLRKRIPPNPIQATIEVDGDFDKYPRFYYQFLDIIKRTKPSLQRLTEPFFRK